ncbi:ATP-binding protein [Rhodococcus sp. NPDC127528]|uniref:ATP-binding protein n=1 Tax=unclassified Rhodococcus (in: high G+C Gram-positive bacteria) TaxID=192944 RepID=UPI003632B338
MAVAVRGKVGNLPLELTSFVGRRRELAEARRLLSESRVVTLTGMGGVGKTRLALRLAADSRRVFTDGVWLVELAELHDPALLTDTVAVALGLREHSAQPPLELLADHLAALHVLLLLDNCEHQVEPVAGLAAFLLRTCPELRILATSREPLSIGGESVLRVPPLTVPDPHRPASLQGLPSYEAVTLFTERACSAVPGFGITEDNQDAVTRICQQLDGLPLPIELAVARLRSMSPEQILQRLTDRYQLLTRGSRSAPTRQQTLRMCIDWSYELCTESERVLWARLSVFAGGFELDAAEDVCGGDPTAQGVLDGVSSLVDKSILIREEPGNAVRYRLLETLSDYGRERLQGAGEYARLRRRHRDWCERLVHQAGVEWIGPRQAEWIARLGREQPNLRDAMEFSLVEPAEADAGLRIANALVPFWMCFGLLSEGRHWFARLLAAEGAPPDDRVMALCSASQLASMQLDLAAATACWEEARCLEKRVTDRSLHPLLHLTAGRIALYSGDFPRAAERFEDALAGFRDEGDLHREIWSLQGLGIASGARGDYTQAVSWHEQVVAITEPRGEYEYRARANWLLALVLWRQGDRQRASGLMERALRLARVVDDRIAAAGCLEALAWSAAAERQERRAAVLLGAAQAQHQVMEIPAVMVAKLRVSQDECRRQCRRALGDRAFDAAVREGRGLGLADAIAYALGERPDERSGGPATAKTADLLTRRERQVADLVAQGLTNRAIAEKLVISQRTAQGHVEHVLAKLGFNSRTQIAAWVVEQGRG